MTAKKKTEKLPEWDLSDLYGSPNDSKLSKDIKAVTSRAKKFEKKYRGNLAKLSREPKNILLALKEIEKIYEPLIKVGTYAQLRLAETSSESERGAFAQAMRTEYVTIQNLLLFFELELISLSKKTRDVLLKSKQLTDYAHYLDQLFTTAAHRLDERSEALLSEKSLTSSGAWTRFFEQESSLKTFHLQTGKRTKEISLTDALHMLSRPDRALRVAAAKAISKGLEEEQRKNTFVYNTLILDKSISDRLRNYPTPEASRHQANEIDAEVVERMSSEVQKSYPLVQEYYQLKRKLLGLKVLHDYDRYAPLGTRQENIKFSQAREMVLEAFHGFSPRMYEIAKEFFDKNWIDVFSRPGKRGGAFCSFVTPGAHPYVFQNYHGSLRDVFTLAHELGHAIHAYLMREQTLLNFSVPLTLAETASVFAEMLLFESLRGKKISHKQSLQMHCSKIEDIIATVHRQISMYCFEQNAHKLRRERGELSPEQMHQLWIVEQEKVYGESVKLSEGYKYWWSYVSHFMHTPFYVYSYAFGELLTLALYESSKQQSDFEDRYLKFLRSGGSVGPEEALNSFSISLKNRNFWKKGIDLFGELLQSTKELAH